MDVTPTVDPAAAPIDARPPVRARRFDSLETALWIAGFLYQAACRLVRYDLGYDQTIVFPTAVNAMKGWGLGVLMPMVTDLSTTKLQKITYWPPGWALIQIPFLAIIRNAFWAEYLNDVAGLALLVLLTRSFVNRLGDTVSKPARVLLIFSFGFLATPNGDFWYSNLWAVVLFFAAAWLVMPRGAAEAPDSAYFCSGWLLGGCIWMRYQYVAIVGTILLAMFLQPRFRPGLTKIGFHIAGIAVSVVPLLFWRLYPPPFPGYRGPLDLRTVATTPGLHLNGLIYTVPPAAAALLGVAWQRGTLSRLMPESVGAIQSLFIVGCLGWALTIVAVAGAILAVKARNVGEVTRTNVRRFYAIGLSGYLLTLGPLLYLTVIHDVAITHWAYVQVARYHMIVVVFVLVGLAHGASLVTGRMGIALKVVLGAVAVGLGLLSVSNAEMTFSRFYSKNWGPPLERAFWNQGKLTNYLTNRLDTNRLNVLLHIGEGTNEAQLLVAIARYSGYSANITLAPSLIDTVSPVHLVLTTPSNGPPGLRQEFDRLCGELGPEITMGSIILCDGRFMPRRRPQQ